jgi:hypothetical protein
MKYNIVDEQDNVIESNLTLDQAEYWLCWHLNCGAEVWIQEI